MKQAGLFLAARAVLQAPPMPNAVAVELIICGRRRPITLPRIAVMNVHPALHRLDDLREADEISDAVAEQAERVLKAIDRAGSP
jgi:hypothetical protein